MQRIFWGGGGCRVQLQRPPSEEGGNLLGALVHRQDKVEENGLEAARITLFVSLRLLTILTRQSHISKVVVLFQISKSSTLSLILADYFI